MEKLLVQEFLEKHTFGDLQRQHGVYARFDKQGRKFTLNYDQIEAKESDPLACQCRGLVLQSVGGKSWPKDEATLQVCPGPTDILAYPMNRFFNAGQREDPINWSDPKLVVESKLDGSFIVVGYDPMDDRWFFSTRSLPENDLKINASPCTFSELLDSALMSHLGLDLQGFGQRLSKRYTYCFELMSPWNRVVVDYQETKLALIAVRNLDTGLELDPRPIAEAIGIESCPQYGLHSLDDIVAYVSKVNPLEEEGIIVRDSNFNRIKVKSPAYLALNRASFMLTSDRALLELILLEKDDDVLAVLSKEVQERISQLKSNLQEFIAGLDQEYLICKSAAEQSKEYPFQKAFALEVKNRGVSFPAAFFERSRGRCANAREFLKMCKKKDGYLNSFLDSLLEILNGATRDRT